jgi:hypothetical protein
LDITLHVREAGVAPSATSIGQHYSMDADCLCEPPLPAPAAGLSTIFLTCPPCQDANPCTDDSCNPATLGCVHLNNSASCDDGNACTAGDVCSSGVCSGTPAVPPETQSVVASSDKATYSWTTAPYATQYDVVRGSLSAFPVGPGGGDEVCFDNLAGPSLIDATVPGIGTGFGYLARGESACGIGTWGNATSGPRVTTTCP